MTYPSLLMYYQGFDGFETVYESKMSCNERYTAAVTKVDLWR